MDLKIKESSALGGIREKDATSNARLKSYKHVDILQIATRPIFRSKGLEERKQCGSSADIEFSDCTFECEPKKADEKQEIGNESFKSARARAKSAVRSICLMNDFEYMFTWTLNAELVNRYNADEVYKKVRAFLSNATQRKGFKYVLIPEHHSDNRAIHMHGLCILSQIRIVPALTNDGVQRVTKSGRPIFNMIDWKLGYSTAVELEGDYLKAVSYITKYITKSEKKIFGKYYLSSRGIKKNQRYLYLKVYSLKMFFSLMKNILHSMKILPTAD